MKGTLSRPDTAAGACAARVHGCAVALCALLLIVVAGPGCDITKESPPDELIVAETRPTSSVPPPPCPPTSTSPVTFPKRMTTERFLATRNVPREILVVPLKEARPFGSETKIRYPGKRVHVKNAQRVPGFTVPVQCDAADYNELRVRMRVSGGRSCRVTWLSDLEPAYDKKLGASTAILSDSEFHNYVIPLRPPNCEYWAGAITSLIFFPSDEGASATIAKLELAYSPPSRPPTKSIHSQVHEALFGVVPPWGITIPEKAVFEAHMGLQERSWDRCSSDGVTFTGRLTLDSGEKVTLFCETLDPVGNEGHRHWVAAQADLSAYAGHSAQIHLEVDPVGTTAGDYAYWGNPIVFRREEPPEGTEEGAPTPVILVSIDTLRADHVSCYGYERQTTPHLDAWTADAVLFENTATNYVWTLASHATMLTGRYPKNHGADLDANIAEDATILAEALRDAGYLCAAITGHRLLLLPERGFGRGFDHYSTPARSEGRDRDVFDVHGLAVDWLAAHPSPRVFAFIHNYDLHVKSNKSKDQRPYLPASPGPDYGALYFADALGPPPTFGYELDSKILHAKDILSAASDGQISLSPEQHEYIVALYDDCLRAVDQAIGELFDDLRQRRLYEPALIIVTSDHGESMAEHGGYLHHDVYESCAHVPLLIKFPYSRFGGRRVFELTELCDIYPTVLDVLGLPIDPAVDGQSLLALLEERADAKPFTFTRKGELESVRSTDWKLFRDAGSDEYSLYNLASDPGEEHNLYQDAPPSLAGMHEVLDRFYETALPGWRLAVTGGPEPCNMEIGLTLAQAARRLYRVELQEQDALGFEEGDRSMRGHLNVAPGEHKEFFLRTSSEGALQVSLTGTVPFTVSALGELHEPSRDFHATLDPMQSSGQVTAESDPSLTTVIITWTPPGVVQEPAERLSEAARDELEALGYVD